MLTSTMFYFCVQEDVQLMVYRKRARLTKLFELLKQWHTQLNDYVVTYDTWYKLMNYTNPKMTEDMIKVYFLVLTDGEPYISKFLSRQMEGKYENTGGCAGDVFAKVQVKNQSQSSVKY